MVEEESHIIENKKILITGGGGFIGSNLADKLSINNNITVIDNLSTGKLSNIEGEDIEFIQGSITDLELIREVCKNKHYVFHLAALPSVPRSLKKPLLTHEVNATGTLNVLKAALENDVKRVVYASSSSVYGNSPTLPKVEDMIPNPLSPYAVSKLSGEYYCRVFYEVYGLKTTCVRYFNVYGPKQNPKGDYAAVIPKFINRILDDKPPIIFGDGEQSRDFTFVGDTVRGTILAAKAERGYGEVINIATGSRITINDLAEKIGKLFGIKVNPIHNEARDGDVRHSLAQISKARDLLEYEPQYHIDKGLAETVYWYRSAF